MNHFSRSLAKFIKRRYPTAELITPTLNALLEIRIAAPRDARMGGLIVQSTPVGNIWLRIHPANAVYLIDGKAELVQIMDETRSEQLIWAIGYDGEEWSETTLARSIEYLTREPGVTYFVYSWTGRADCVLDAEPVHTQLVIDQ